MKREYDFGKGEARGRRGGPKNERKSTTPLDRKGLEWFRTEVDRVGGGYQNLVHEALRQRMGSPEETLEEALQTVIREQIRRAS